MTYNAAQTAQIDLLADTVEGYAVPMAVVDYHGKRMQVFGHHSGLKFATVDEDTPVAERFGTRDLGHVKQYDLTIVRLNAAARGGGP
ncbi:MAG: hypothetical protein V3S55_15360 [Nitrospiraceae bacterium]